ncbi:MAG: bifunctional UDP-N-acetylglucosamine diphosphorylase/glucosamine-1-phosphate N-acetyltransferase GlmU [Bdellovibrionales bacterium]|nr:bifunctional UDP-N-acetylglucosamine diphosphorylase/glucosamine-1-phosphate N-acetyltransferase GlmU [Bdellovibrionales bacterium]
MCMASSLNFSVIILAAGKGTRMKSPLPKVIHPVAGQPMIYRIVDAASKAGALETRLVVGAGSKLVQRVVEPLGASCFFQEKQLGTADAVASAEPGNLEGPVIIIGGDHPLMTSRDFEWLVKEYNKRECQLAVVSCEVDEPGSYGRIVRNHGKLYSIVEAKDASADTLKIKEVNTGIYVMDAEVLNKYLPKISNENQQNEYYFTDIISLSLEGGESVDAIIGEAHMAQGVNDQEQLAAASKSVFSRKASELMKEGVIFVDPERTYIEDDVKVAAGTVIYPGVYIKGPSQIGSHCVLEPNVFIEKAQVGDSVQLKAGTYLNDCTIEKGATLGPYAHIRPQTEIGEDCKIGNFVELKKTKMGKGSKASHLAYLGDAEVGENVNFGCGAITVNYAVDKKKYKTVIEDEAFVGSDCQLVAPVTVGKGAMIGAGSTITKDVPENALAVSRSKQIVKENYQPKAPSNSKPKH